MGFNIQGVPINTGIIMRQLENRLLCLIVDDGW